MQRKNRFFVIIFVLFAAFSALSQPTSIQAAMKLEARVSPPAIHFPQNKQNESPMAISPQNPLVAITGANDEIQEPDCTPATGGSSNCPFNPTTNTSGVYWTKNGGLTWAQTILPWFQQAGITSDGDAAVTFGPKPGPNGFNWSNGVRTYFGSLAGSPTFGPAKELLAVSYSDDCADPAAATCTWSPPVVATNKDNPVSFNDKIAIWADQTATSPHFGNVYVSWTLFIGNPTLNFGESSAFSPEPIVIAHSTDGGLTYSPPEKLTSSANNGSVGGRQGSTIRTAPDGTVYVFWDGAQSRNSAVMGARSDDGAVSFDKQFLVSIKSDVPPSFPGTSFRVNSFPMADVDQSGKLYVVWADYTNGHSVVKLAKSTDGGANWKTTTAADVSGRSAFYPAVAVNGSKVFIGFNAIDDKPAGTAPGAGVVLYDAYYVNSSDGGTSFAAPVKISAKSSDPDVATTNGLTAQFLGDYNGASAGSNGNFFFSWTDTRNGSTCADIDSWRASNFTTTKPNIYDKCPPGFGDSDIFVAIIQP